MQDAVFFPFSLVLDAHGMAQGGSNGFVALAAEHACEVTVAAL